MQRQNTCIFGCSHSQWARRNTHMKEIEDSSEVKAIEEMNGHDIWNDMKREWNKAHRVPTSTSTYSTDVSQPKWFGAGPWAILDRSLGRPQAHPLVVRGELEPGYVLAENSWRVKPLNRWTEFCAAKTERVLQKLQKLWTSRVTSLGCR